MKGKLFLLLATCAVLISCKPSLASESAAPSLESKFIQPAGRQILALFDSSEETSKDRNPIKEFIEQPLQEMGLEIVYHDIHKGLPSSKSMRGVRGIISWYSDGQMKQATRYCHWLAREIKNGKKAVLIDNFGAYQDLRNQKWTDLEVVNLVFRQLGVEYRATWTSDHEKLKVSSKDAGIVEKVAPINLQSIAHYYLFAKMDEAVKDYLTVTRTDVNQGDSAVIFSHPKGGMALTRYFTVVDPKSRRLVPNIDFSLFLRKCFEPGEASGIQSVLIIWDKGADTGNHYLQNITWTLTSAKIDYHVLAFKKLEKIMPSDLKEYSALILYAPRLSEVENSVTMNLIRMYVASGGGLLVAHYAQHPLLNEVFGIQGSVEEDDLETTEGFRVVEPFFPGAEFMSYPEEDLSSDALNVFLSEKQLVLARSLNFNKRYPEGIPIAWLNQYGGGRVVYWNSGYLRYKIVRGLLLQSLLLTRPIFVYSFVNVENVHIDDFPQPVYNAYKEPIKTTMNLTDTEFYLNVWLKDILSLAKEFGVRFTCYTIFNYDAKRAPPFAGREFTIGNDKASSQMADTAFQNNFELGLHGYNHQPLVIDKPGFGDWQSKKNMTQGLVAARDLWGEFFPDVEQPFSYVAPMNLISREGKEALHEVFPSIRVVSAVTGFYDETDETLQEFGPDPDVPELYNIPRMTSGYLFTQRMKSTIVNYINTVGVWTHFIHPDDIFDPGRLEGAELQGINPSDWGGLVQSMRSIFTFVRTQYPWLRSLSTKDAYFEIKRYFEDKRRVELKDDLLTVSFASGSQASKYFGVKINDGARIASMENCRLLHSYANSNIFLFVTELNSAKIRLTH